MKRKEVPLIYLTAFSDRATIERVKHTNPSSFLTKPYHMDNVRVAIDLALYHFSERQKTEMNEKPLAQVEQQEKRSEKEQILQLREYLFIKQNYRYVKSRLADIRYMEADNNYVNIQTTTQKFTVRLSLSDLLERISDAQLIRVHRSFAIHMDAISSFDEQLIRIDNREIPIGRNFQQDFMDRFRQR